MSDGILAAVLTDGNRGGLPASAGCHERRRYETIVRAPAPSCHSRQVDGNCGRSVLLLDITLHRDYCGLTGWSRYHSQYFASPTSGRVVG
jgi:hypothetical protein